MIENPPGASKAHPIHHWNHTHDCDLTLSNFSFKEATYIITYLKDIPITSFVWRCRFDFLTLFERSISMNSVHCSVIFFWRGRNTTLTSTADIPLFRSRRSAPRSVVGAPSGRHSRLGPVFSASHSLQASNASTRWWNSRYLWKFTFPYCALAPKTVTKVSNEQGFSVMPTETKIKYYLRQRIFSSIKACSLETLSILRYFSGIPSWDIICRDSWVPVTGKM